MSAATLEAPAIEPNRTATPEPPEGRPGRGRAMELEGYRGLAALTIIAFHVLQSALASGGTHTGLVSRITRLETVDVLFTLSAYLLTISYARSAIDGTPGLPPGQFLFRRAVRILPLYWIGVTAVWAMRNPTLPGDWRDLLEHLTFTQVFDRTRIFYTLGPTWSMSLEVMFYALLAVGAPLACRLCAGIDNRRRRVAILLGICATLFAIPVLWNNLAFLAFKVPYDNWPVYFGPQARFAAFAAGMALAVLVAARRSAPVFTGIWPLVLRVASLLVIVGATLINRPGSWGQAVYHDFAAVAWFLLIASTVLGSRGQRWSHTLAWRPLALVGLISYSTYMWHEPLMQFLQKQGIINRSVAGLPWALTIVLAGSLLVGTLSYQLIEKPTNKLRRLRTSSGAKRDYYAELV